MSGIPSGFVRSPCGTHLWPRKNKKRILERQEECWREIAFAGAEVCVSCLRLFEPRAFADHWCDDCTGERDHERG